MGFLATIETVAVAVVLIFLLIIIPALIGSMIVCLFVLLFRDTW